MKKGRLKEIVSELQGASKMHLQQSKDIEKHIEEMNSPLSITESAYEKSNVKMRKENPGMGKRLTDGTSPRRVSFACRFAGMKGAMKEANGEPTRKAKALKKWGFGSVEAARNFCQKNKSKK